MRHNSMNLLCRYNQNTCSHLLFLIFVPLVPLASTKLALATSFHLDLTGTRFEIQGSAVCDGSSAIGAVLVPAVMDLLPLALC